MQTKSKTKLNLNLKLKEDDKGPMKWMYGGPQDHVNREEYLLGRQVDKNFEQLQEAERKGSGSGHIVEYDCVPPSLFGSSSSTQVDTLRKVQEDPLLQIRKKEDEELRKILDNPVKLKQLQKQVKKIKRHKRNISKKSKKSSKYDDLDLDALLKDKLKALRKKKKIRHSYSSGEKEKDKCKFKHRTSAEKSLSRVPSYIKHVESSSPLPLPRLNRLTESSSPSSTYPMPESSTRSHLNRLTDREKEDKRREMMKHAEEMNKQRIENVDRYNKEEEKEKAMEKLKTRYLREELSIAAGPGSLEGRIKSNIYNIQRTRADMDKNFARR